MKDENLDWQPIRSDDINWWNEIPGEETEFPPEDLEDEYAVPVPRPGMARGGLTFSQLQRMDSLDADYSELYWRNMATCSLLLMDSDSQREVMAMVNILIKAGFSEDESRACVIESWNGTNVHINRLLYHYLHGLDLPLVGNRGLLRSILNGIRERGEDREGNIGDRRDEYPRKKPGPKSGSRKPAEFPKVYLEKLKELSYRLHQDGDTRPLSYRIVADKWGICSATTLQRWVEETPNLPVPWQYRPDQ